MNAPDIRVSTTLIHHRKFRKFKRIVGDLAMEYLVAIWSTVAEQCPTGVLAGWEAEDVADACQYKGEDPLRLVEALRECGLLDVDGEHWELHDWAEHQAYVCDAPSRIEKARNAAKARWNKGTKQRACGEDATSSAEHMPPSLPFPSLPSPPKDMKKRNGHFVPPTPDGVSEYGRSIGYQIDGQRFCDFYASKGWMVGKNKMRDWQAAVRTWKTKANSDSAKEQATVDDYWDKGRPRLLNGGGSPYVSREPEC